MRTLLSVILSLIATLTTLSAQQCGLTFEPTIIDFGHIDEDGGIATRSFRATNITKESITIKELVSTCDCTVAQYNNIVIEPNQSFEFKVSYNPMNRPGRFDRPLYVLVEGSDEILELNVRGYVDARERSIEERYYNMDNDLYVESTFAPFSYLEHGKRYEERIDIYNNSSRTMRLRIESYATKSGLLRIEYPKTVESESHGDIVFIYELPADSHVYGDVDDDLAVYVNGKRCGILLTAHGIAVDNFDDYDDILSPRAEYSKKVINFGDVNADLMPLSATLTITNRGEAPLFVRDVRCNEAWAIKHNIRPGDEIGAGETKVYDVQLDLGKEYMPLTNPGTTALLSGNVAKGKPFNARIAITTSDAIVPYQTITIKAQYHSPKQGIKVSGKQKNRTKRK
ncbi:MAG: DUF1573 domain-containing protein [Alistipes sp.]|nr:DUF1573 domain-containing protein [Alistipes sp.]